MVLVYSDTCGPCTKLKPALYKRIQNSSTQLYIIRQTCDPQVIEYLDVQKIPHVAVIRNGDKRQGIQNSDIEITWNHIQTELAEFTTEEDF